MFVLGLAATQMPLGAQCTPSTPNVLTAQNDNQRDSYNGNEPCLNSTTISSTSPLSQLMRLDVDTDNIPSGYLSNAVYAQPLYLAGVTVSYPATTANCSPTCNLAIGVTLNTTIFAWNATTGNVVWSRRGGPTGTTSGTSGYALYYTDCSGGSVATIPPPHALPYLGILSTPVIDNSLSPPTMFLTSYCADSGGANHWYLHGIDLTTGYDVVSSGGIQVPACPASYTPPTGGWPTGSNGADGLSPNLTCTSGSYGAIRFYAQNQNQRPALLEVGSEIYMGFGVHSVEEATPTGYPAAQTASYHGWVMAYNRAISTSSNPDVAFATTSQGNHDGSQNSSAPNCDINTLIGGSNYQNEPNWCGHGAGVWMSGHGPAATASTLADGYTHIFLGSGNGGFQQSGQNWGQSVMDFRYSSSSGPQSSPFQSFTPYGGVPVEPNPAWAACGCNSSGGSCGTTCTSFEVLNTDDWDMATSGVLLFQGTGGENYAVTIDKAGYGYLLQQGNLCGGTPNSGLTQCNSSPQSYTSGDPGNIFPFLATLLPCGSGSGPQNTDCDRVTGLATFYDGTKQWLYLWPNTIDPTHQERLTALQFNTASVTPPGSPTVTAPTFGTDVIGSGTYFKQWLIPGDTISVSGHTTQTVTDVISNTELTISPGYASTFSTPAALTSYFGYFVNPRPDFAPDPNTTGYPGGSIAVTSNGGSNGVVWSIISADNDPSQSQDSNEYYRTQGYLWVYQATPGTSGGVPGMLKLWDSKNSTCDITGTSNPCQNFCASPFAVPTVVQSMVFVPTYAINKTTDTSHSCPTDSSPATAYNSGILVYGQ